MNPEMFRNRNVHPAPDSLAFAEVAAAARRAVVEQAKRILTLRGDLAKKAMDGAVEGKDLIIAAADVDAAEHELTRKLAAL